MQVKIDQLTKAYGMPMFGQTIALDNVFLEFPGAELVAIVGANGDGGAGGAGGGWGGAAAVSVGGE